MVNETLNILKFLISNQEKKYSIRGLSKVRKINYKSAYQAVMKLNKAGIVKLEKLGNTTNCSFIPVLTPLVFQAENERRQELIKDKNFKVILSHIQDIVYPSIILLFGSYIKGTQSKGSDIDLLLISDNDDAQRTLSMLPIVHLSVFTYNEFMQMLKSKEYSVVGEAVKKNIILAGVEDYYRLINHVG